MILTEIVTFGKQSCRKLAERIGRSKSSVHRHEQARQRRDHPPESVLWETEAGAAWLRTLFFATLYVFGLQSHVGADTLEEFFKLLRLDQHLGVSASVLRKRLNQMEALLPRFQQQCELEAGASPRSGVVVADETFMGDLVILVLMELHSGYLLMEELAEDRKFETWLEKARPRLEAVGLQVDHAVTDRAKPLIKLAEEGFECGSGTDLFHAQYDLSRWLGAKLGRRQAQAEQQVEATATALEQAPAETQVAALVASVDAERAREAIQTTCAESHEQWVGIAEDVHPFPLHESRPKAAAEVVSDLEKRAQALETLAKSADIADSRQTLRKFRGQFDALAIHITFWWQWVMNILTDMAVDAATREWLTHSLLPVVYWHHQMRKTKSKRQRENYEQAWQRAVDALRAQEFTQTLSESALQHWVEWAQWMAGALSPKFLGGRGAQRLSIADVSQWSRLDEIPSARAGGHSELRGAAPGWNHGGDALV